MGFGIFDINDPTQAPAGSAKPGAIGVFLADVQETRDKYRRDNTNRSVLTIKKQAEMRETAIKLS